MNNDGYSDNQAIYKEYINHCLVQIFFTVSPILVNSLVLIRNNLLHFIICDLVFR